MEQLTVSGFDRVSYMSGANRADLSIAEIETIEHYEVLIANQAALVTSMQPSKRRDAEQLKLDNLRAELEAVKAQ